MNVREWAPLRALPVLPLKGRGTGRGAVERQVRNLYPGPLAELEIIRLPRISAAILVPRTGLGREADLPVPALILNRRGSPREGLFRAATARGYDLYRLRAGVLEDAWSSPTAPGEAVEIPPPTTLKGALAINVVRASGRRSRWSYLLTAVLLLTALAARITLDQLPLPPEQHRPPPPGTTGITTAPPAPIAPLLPDLTLLAESVPAFRLEGLEAAAGRATIRFSTSEIPAGTIDLLRQLEIPGPGGTYQILREEEITRVTLEDHYE
jgi:hypothetical protein